MKDRVRDLLLGLLLLSLVGALPDLSAAEGWAALGLAALLLVSLTTLLREDRPGALPRILFLAGTLFLAVQPYAAPEERTLPMPARALILLGVALVLWAHMNIQSVSGRLAWDFSRVDVAIIAAAGWVVAASLSLLWLSPESRLIPQILLQGMAVTVGIFYLYCSRWRPDRGTFLAAALALAVLLGGGFVAARARDRALSRAWEDLARSWSEGPPEPGSVEAVVQAARLTRPSMGPLILSRAALAAVESGRSEAARAWSERAVRSGGDLPHPWLALAAAAAAGGDALAAEEARNRGLPHLAPSGSPPSDLGPVPPILARAVAVDLLDVGRPEAALRWIETTGPAGRYDLRLLQAEALLQAGRAEEGEAMESALTAEYPDRAEPRLGLVRARLARGKRDSALQALWEADAAGAPEVLVLPLIAGLAPGDDPRGQAARRLLADGIEVIGRDDWPDLHPNGNFLYGEEEDRRIPLLLIPGRRYELRIEARGESAGGSPPRMVVELSGRKLATFDVGSSDWEWFPVELAPSGSACTLRLTFPNDYSLPGGGDRNLVVGAVELSEVDEG